MAERRLADRVAIVTGAGTGMGRAIALVLAEEGALVVLAGRRAELLAEAARAVEAIGGAVVVQVTDVTEPAQCQALAPDSARPLGTDRPARQQRRRQHAAARLRRRDARRLERRGATNLDGVYYCTQAVLPTMRAQGGGQIVNISSLAGRRASVMSGVAYSAAKHGVIALTQSVNDEEWRHGVRASCVEPGETATPILESGRTCRRGRRRPTCSSPRTSPRRCATSRHCRRVFSSTR